MKHLVSFYFANPLQTTFKPSCNPHILDDLLNQLSLETHLNKMKLSAITVLFYGMNVACSATTPTRQKDIGKCTNNADCAAFLGTVCVQILTGDYSYGKCTPNVDYKPVCRGAQAGLCPRYKSSTQGYLNTQCVLIDKSMQPSTGELPIIPINQKSTAGSSTGSITITPKVSSDSKSKSNIIPARYLQTSNSTRSTSGSSTVDISSSGKLSKLPCPSNSALLLSDPNCWYNTAYDNVTITVQYRCVDYDMCLSQSAASQATQKSNDAYCRPKGCVTGDHELCNNRGTCQGNSPLNAMRPEGYSCRCYAGYTGSKCEKTKDASCEVDCGNGGACLNNTCACYEGWNGKDMRCAKCTSNIACENGNTCNLDTGKCDCADGYVGATCGGKTDPCIGVTCSDGGTCKFVKNIAQCFCFQCSGDNCQKCNEGDCSSAVCPANITSSAINLCCDQNTISLYISILLFTVVCTGMLLD